MGTATAQRHTSVAAALGARVRQQRAKQQRRVFPCDEFRDDPVGFAREVLGFEPWDEQATWMRAVAPEDSATSVASGHKTGKSTGAAAIALWFWGTRRRARVVLMAPKIEHVRIVLWPEIRRLYLAAGRCAACRAKNDGAPPCESCSPLGSADWIADVDPTKGLRSPDGREIFAYTSRTADAIGGISGPEMLFEFDEASGVPEPVFEAMKGNEAGGVRKLLLGNPIRTSGEFYESHNRGKRFYTHAQTISSEATPNARSGEKLVPGLATREWVEKRAEEWGRDSALFAVRVLGKFPKAEAGQLVPVDVLEAAEERWESMPAHGPLQIGVDVAFAEEGDDQAIAVRRGQKILELTTTVGLDEDGLALRIVGIARAHRRDREAKPVVLYDANGAGSRLRAPLARYADEIEIRPVYGTNKSSRPREFLQLRDEVIWNFAQWLRGGGAIPTDLKLEGEISHTKRFSVGSNDKLLRISSNDEIRKVLKRSPDRRNACELAVWEPRGARAEADPVVDQVHVPLDPYAGGLDPYAGASPWGAG